MNPRSSIQSPISPYETQSRRSISAQHPGQLCYPESPQHEQQSQSLQRPQPSQQGAQGLGLYPGSMPPPQQSTVSPAMASPHPDWSQQQPSSGAEQQTEYASSQPPDIFSAAFDPFSGFSASSNTAGMVGAHSPEAPGLEFCQTPPSSNMQSHRGSVSSYAPSDSGSNGGAYTPRAKHEDQAGEWYTGSSNDLQRAISQAPMPYPSGAPAIGSQTEQLYRESQPDALYRSQHHEWSKSDTQGYITELGASTDGRPRFDSMQPVLPSASRVRKRRQRTTPEEATHECRTCGKLFKRSYNWKSHMETHNPERKYPHPCTHMVGSSQCSKKFQRKTDLDRHVDSVSWNIALCHQSNANISPRCTSSRGTTSVRSAATALRGETPCDVTPKTAAPSGSSSISASSRPMPTCHQLLHPCTLRLRPLSSVGRSPGRPQASHLVNHLSAKLRPWARHHRWLATGLTRASPTNQHRRLSTSTRAA